ncbi:glycosyltransferase family 4 protein [Gracilibacillus phocaeensis]|uniref:glycosyltransferase family 4 protein n=1 Tax=Gracilibacillus phocaeensis TaxID=2042304 RepID=UPI001030EF07|nr:glycosyltransferase family 4 protein [Gracilibacillus phocaeensis]
MKKILMISQNFYPEIGSAGNRMKNIYLLLKERGFDINVLTTDPTYPNRNIYSEDSFWDHEELNEDHNIHRVRITNKKYSRNIFNRLLYYLEMAWNMVFFVLFNRSKYDTVIVTSPPIFVAIVGVIAKFRFRAKLILDIRDLWPESLRGVGVFNYPFIINLFKKVEKIIYSKADHIVVNSKGFIDYIIANSKRGEDKLVYLPNGARNNEIIAPETTSDHFKVIYAGNIGLAQDYKVIMNLARELNQKNIELTIIGYGMRRHSLIDYIEENDLDNVTFINPTTREECLKLISDHQVGIVTLEKEDVFKTVLPGKIIDYMTRGVPMVASVSGYSKEILVKEETGFVSQNLNELVAYIEELKSNKDLYDRISKKGRQYVNDHFLWENNIETLVRIIN